MKINSIQNSNIAKVNFKSAEGNSYTETSNRVKEITDKYIEKDDIKSPGQVAFSMGLIALKTFVFGVAAAAFTASIFNSAPAKTEKVLKGISNSLADYSKKTVDNPANVLQKAGNILKETVGKTEAFAKNAYKKVICKGFAEIPKDATKEVIDSIKSENAYKAFTRLGGFGALAWLSPALLTRDRNGDGIKDVLQHKSQQMDKKFNELGNDVLAMTQLSNLLK